MNMHRVYLKVADYNRRTISCYRSCGFEIEGELRDDHFHNGEYMNSLLMSILKGNTGANRVLEGERVRPRAVERGDLPTFVRWINDPQVTQYLELEGPISMEQEEQWFESLSDGEARVFSIETRESKLIGNIGVLSIDGTARNASICNDRREGLLGMGIRDGGYDRHAGIHVR